MTADAKGRALFIVDNSVSGWTGLLRPARGQPARRGWRNKHERTRERENEIKADLNGCLEEVEQGTTLDLMNGEHRIARIVPKPRTSESTQEVVILPGKGKLTEIKPLARLRGGGRMTDIVRENRR